MVLLNPMEKFMTNNLIVLEDEGFDINSNLNSKDHVLELKSFLSNSKYSDVNKMPMFDQCFDANQHNLIGCVEDLSAESQKFKGIQIVLM